MGEVYLGEDTRLGRKVAIKVLPAEFASDPERLARFEQEARAAAALNHPHIAVVHDIGCDRRGDTHFMVQEYLEGQSLRERLDKGALYRWTRRWILSIEVGEALIAAHKAGIIHRDLKPDNIFVTEGRAREGVGLRAGEADRDGRTHRNAVDVADHAGHRSRTGDGHRGVHGPRADQRRGDRPPSGSVCLRLRALRDGHGARAFAGKNVFTTR